MGGKVIKDEIRFTAGAPHENNRGAELSLPRNIFPPEN